MCSVIFPFVSHLVLCGHPCFLSISPMPSSLLAHFKFPPLTSAPPAYVCFTFSLIFVLSLYSFKYIHFPHLSVTVSINTHICSVYPELFHLLFLSKLLFSSRSELDCGKYAAFYLPTIAALTICMESIAHSFRHSLVHGGTSS